MSLPRLGVNIDHVATLRQLRGTSYPDLLKAMDLAILGGAEGITIHLREDRRHIQDQDVLKIVDHSPVPVNLEMGMNPKILQFALKARPEWVCLVPEKRKELTTEGGLNLKSQKRKILDSVSKLNAKKIKVSLFIEPDLKNIELAKNLGVQAVELHTGEFANVFLKNKKSLIQKNIQKIKKAADLGNQLGLRVHAGHGLTPEMVRLMRAQVDENFTDPKIIEYNIGHWLICQSVFLGLEASVREMISALRAP